MMFGLFKKKKDTPAVENNETKAAEETPAETLVEEPATTPEPSPQPEPEREPERDVFVPPPGMHGGMDSGIPGFAYSPVDPDEEFKATGGKPLPEGEAVTDKETIIAALQTVYDPEIPVNIYDLGLIYTCEIGETGDVKIEMSLTAPGCPVAGEMPGMVARAVEAVEGTGEVEVTLVWEPQWNPGLMSEDAKLALGMD